MTPALLAALALALALPAQAAQASIAFDEAYDDGALSTLGVACSDGPNGLYTRGFRTLGALPGFPFVGGASAVAGWNSPSCGRCFRLEFQGAAVFVTAVGSAKLPPGGAGAAFVVSLATLDRLTKGQGRALGRVAGTSAGVASANCKM